MDHQRRLRRLVHRLCQSRRRAVLRVHRRARVSAASASGKEEHKMGLHGSSTTPLILQDAQRAGGQSAWRDRQGPQDRVQRPELRPLQAGGDVQRRREGGDRRSGAYAGPARSSASRSPGSARSGRSSPRWRCGTSRSRACSTGRPADRHAIERHATTPAERARARSRNSRSKRRC